MIRCMGSFCSGCGGRDGPRAEAEVLHASAVALAEPRALGLIEVCLGDPRVGCARNAKRKPANKNGISNPREKQQSIWGDPA